MVETVAACSEPRNSAKCKSARPRLFTVLRMIAASIKLTVKLDLQSFLSSWSGSPRTAGLRDDTIAARLSSGSSSSLRAGAVLLRVNVARTRSAIC